MSVTEQVSRIDGNSGPGIQPLNDRVMIERERAIECTSGGVVIPNGARKKSDRGRVVRVGTGGLDTAGRRVPIRVKPGDLVVINRHCGEEYRLDGREYLLIGECDILALLKD